MAGIYEYKELTSVYHVIAVVFQQYINVHNKLKYGHWAEYTSGKYVYSSGNTFDLNFESYPI
jgi:hypothetical protein